MPKITQNTIHHLKPRDVEYDIRCSDITGFLIRVQPSGNATFYVNWGRGKRIKLGAVGVLTLDQARTAAKKRLAEVAEFGRPQIRLVAGATLRDFLTDHYEAWNKATRKDGTANIRQIRKSFKSWLDKAMMDLTPAVWGKWATKRREAGIKPATLNRDLTRIKGLLARAVEWHIIPSHPLAAVKPQQTDNMGVVRYLSVDEEASLRDALREVNDQSLHLPPIVLLAMNTGMRRGEITALTWGDIDFTHKVLTVRAATAKSNKTRHIPLNLEAMTILEEWRGEVVTDSKANVFPLREFKHSWRSLMKRAKINKFRFHDTRHHFASRLVQRGVSLYVVQKLLGHSDIKMTMRYAHLAANNFEDAVARLAA